MRRINTGIVVVHISLLFLSSAAAYLGVMQGEEELAVLAITALFGGAAVLVFEAWRTRNRVLLLGELVVAFVLTIPVAVFPYGLGLSLLLIHTYLILNPIILILAVDPIYAVLAVIPLLLLAGFWNPINLTMVYGVLMLIIEHRGAALADIVK